MGVYPTEEDISSAIDGGEMYVCDTPEGIIAAMRINHSISRGYDAVRWSADAAPDEVTVIHLLGVGVRTQKKGLGREMVWFVIDKAAKEGQKAVRLDVLEGNVPAFALYESEGFRAAGTVRLFYEDTGWAEFTLYEYVL